MKKLAVVLVAFVAITLAGCSGESNMSPNINLPVGYSFIVAYSQGDISLLPPNPIYTDPYLRMNSEGGDCPAIIMQASSGTVGQDWTFETDVKIPSCVYYLVVVDPRAVEKWLIVGVSVTLTDRGQMSGVTFTAGNIAIGVGAGGKDMGYVRLADDPGTSIQRITNLIQ